MITAVVYDKVANTQAGMMGYEVRIVGHHYQVLSSPDMVKLLYIVEEMRRDVKVLVLTYDNGYQQIIPDRGVEKITKVE